MKRCSALIVFVVGLGALIPCAHDAAAQKSVAVGGPVPYIVDSGSLDNPGQQSVVVFDLTVEQKGAPWMRLEFSVARLSGTSFLRLTSLRDGAQQSLDTAGLALWQHKSAYFNGDKLRVELVAAAGTRGNRIAMERAIVGYPDAHQEGPETLCGADNRVAAANPAVGMLIMTDMTGAQFIGTTFITNKSGPMGDCLLTAGHNFRDDSGAPAPPKAMAGAVAHFNTPAAGGCSAPADQYVAAKVRARSGVRNDCRAGHDWAVMQVANNSNGNQPSVQQTASLPLIAPGAADVGAARSVIGYGSTAVCPPPQQSDTGAITAVDMDSFSYTIDTQPGNSGSPIVTSLGSANGIHTCGGCTAAGGSNSGTKVDNPNLQAALAACENGTLAAGIDWAESGAWVVPSLSGLGVILLALLTLSVGVASVRRML